MLQLQLLFRPTWKFTCYLIPPPACSEYAPTRAWKRPSPIRCCSFLLCIELPFPFLSRSRTSAPSVFSLRALACMYVVGPRYLADLKFHGAHSQVLPQEPGHGRVGQEGRPGQPHRAGSPEQLDSFAKPGAPYYRHAMLHSKIERPGQSDRAGFQEQRGSFPWPRAPYSMARKTRRET